VLQVTVAHYALIVRVKKQGILELCFTILLVITFTLLQGMKYIKVFFNLNTSVFGYSFFRTDREIILFFILRFTFSIYKSNLGYLYARYFFVLNHKLKNRNRKLNYSTWVWPVKAKLNEDRVVPSKYNQLGLKPLFSGNKLSELNLIFQITRIDDPQNLQHYFFEDLKLLKC